jgi:hypothetical protein
LIEEHYTDLFESLKRTLASLQGSGHKFAVQDLNGLLAVLRTVKANQTATKVQLVQELRKLYHNYEVDQIIRTMELVARIWLGVHIASTPHWSSVGIKDPHDTNVTWLEEQRLDEMPEVVLPSEPHRSVVEDYSLGDSFTFLNLRKLRHLKIRWTDNLVDHLKLAGRPGNRTLSVYNQKICLVNHLKNDAPIIQKEILVEAICTLDLFFPISDEKTAPFLRKEMVNFYHVSPPERSGPMSLNEFTYWRSNIVQLLELLNGPPETVGQMMLDTRIASQFTTLWVAIFGVFLLTILFGILATVYSIKQYYIAVLSYNLAVAVTCVEHPEMQHYCGAQS